MDYVPFLQFAIPFRAVPKMRPRFTRNGGTYTPQKTRDWENTVRGCATLALRGRAPLTGKVRVRLSFGGSNADIDNLAKSCLDAMNKVIFTDDKLIEDLIVAKRPRARPCVVIAVDGEGPLDYEKEGWA